MFAVFVLLQLQIYSNSPGLLRLLALRDRTLIIDIKNNNQGYALWELHQLFYQDYSTKDDELLQDFFSTDYISPTGANGLQMPQKYAFEAMTKISLYQAYYSSYYDDYDDSYYDDYDDYLPTSNNNILPICILLYLLIDMSHVQILTSTASDCWRHQPS